ncbi:MAG: response regulator [Candidatus Latescibacterota bacterium]
MSRGRPPSRQALVQQIDELTARLQAAEEALRARSGDAADATPSSPTQEGGTHSPALRRANEELVRAQAALEARARILDALMEHLPEGISIGDAPDARVRLISRYGRELLGGADPWTAYHADGTTPMAPEETPLARAVRRGEVVRDAEMVHVNARGDRLWLLCNAGPIRDAGGVVVGGVAAWRDITERKLAEEALRRAHDRLEQRVSERTAQLEQRARQLAQLASQWAMTEQRERRRLARSLHDHLQQLLVGARFQMDLLSRSAAGEPVAHEQVCQLLDEAIEASRSLTAELSPPVLHEAGLAAGLEWLARWMRDHHGLEVELEVDRAADPEREDVRVLLFEAVRELLHNVVQHAGVSRAHVRLSALGASQLEIAVRDEGRGFDPRARQAAGGSGAGLGLFGIGERVTLLSGRLETDSAPGQGTRVRLIAPRGAAVPAPAVAEPLPAATVAGGPGPGAPSRRLRVLLADDHVVMRQGLSLLLAMEGDVEVVAEASTGREALDKARQLRPDVVLMDFSMPEMDGVEATRLIHAELPDIRIIGLSMYGEGDLADAMQQAGAATYLTKSGRTEALLAAIRGAG